MKSLTNKPATGNRVSKTVVDKNTTGDDKYVTTYYIRDLAEGVYTTPYRLLDMRIGRWMSVDPLFGKYPDMGAYGYCGGNQFYR